MYAPNPIAVTDRRELLAFIEEEPFGMFVSSVDGKPFATHAPFIVSASGEAVTLGLHIAKANPQWRTLEGQEVLAVFRGAHAFISANWYSQPTRHVPTWNYAAVHCTGKARLTDAAQTKRIIERLVERFEPSWRMENADADYIERLQQAIVGIEIAVESIQGVFKYNNDHPPQERERIIDALAASSRTMDREVSARMRATLR